MGHLSARQADNSRAAIQTTRLINLLQEHVHGDVDLSQSRIKAIEILLRKSLPDLKSIEHTGEVGFKEVLKALDDGELAESIRDYAGRAGLKLVASRGKAAA